MRGYTLLTILLLPLLAGQFHAYHSASLFNAPDYSCGQKNQTYIMCQDGRPITFGFSVTAPSNPVYGNFTVYETDFSNVSEPLSVFGTRCLVSPGQTVTCFSTLKPFSIFEGNGTENESMRFKVTSTNYPQEYIFTYANFTVYHYLNSSEIAFAGMYDPTVIRYRLENSTYWNTCSGYFICNATLESGFSKAGNAIANAVIELSRSNLQGAFYYVNVTDAVLLNQSQTLQNFTAYAGKIINNTLAANAILGNMTSEYASNSAALSRCTYTNGTAYSSRITSIIDNLSKYPAQNMLNGSMRLLNYAKNASKTTSGIISACLPSATTSHPIIILPTVNGSGGIIAMLLRYKYYIAIAAVVIVIIALFARSRISNAREIRRIRGDETHGQEGSAVDEGGGKTETVQETEATQETGNTKEADDTGHTPSGSEEESTEKPTDSGSDDYIRKM